MAMSYRELEKEVIALRERMRTLEKMVLNGSTITVKNNERFSFEDASGTRGVVFIVNDTSDNLSIANLQNGKEIFIILACDSGQQIPIQFREDPVTADDLQIVIPYGTRITAPTITLDGTIILPLASIPTSDPASAGQVWRDGSKFLKISTG